MVQGSVWSRRSHKHCHPSCATPRRLSHVCAQIVRLKLAERRLLVVLRTGGKNIARAGTARLSPGVQALMPSAPEQPVSGRSGLKRRLYD